MADEELVGVVAANRFDADVVIGDVYVVGRYWLTLVDLTGSRCPYVGELIGDDMGDFSCDSGEEVCEVSCEYNVDLLCSLYGEVNVENKFLV